MTIQTKLLVIISSMLLLMFLALSYFNYQQSIQNAQQDLYSQADKVRNLLMAYRHTGQKAFLEQQIQLTDKTLHLLPAFAMGQMSKAYSRWDKSGFSFNNVSDQPRNPEHQADALELKIMSYFRNNDDQQTVFKAFINDRNEKYFIYARPIWIKKMCLKCHSTPEQAPKAIRERYTNAYNYELGDLRGILSIKMPAAVIEKRAWNLFYNSAQIQLLGFISIFIMVMVIIRSSIIKPLSQLSDAMLDVSNGDLSKRISGLHGEFATMQQSFNVMGEELQNNQNELENRVEQRTRQLSESNNALTEALDTLQNAQLQLIEKEKMAALGGLVAGVAHEINTPLGVSVTAASHLQAINDSFKKKFHSSSLKKADLESYLDDNDEASLIILNNLNRAAELIRSFKLIAVDQSQHNKRVFNIKQYIEEVLISLKPALKKVNHSIEISCPENIEVNCHPGQFSQIITNLFMNAIKHAFEEGEQGLLKLQVTQTDGQIKFHFSDNGKGISEQNLKKIFTPFFTTARHIGGSGLGLSTIYNIITQNMGGTIRCESIEGKGTDFYFEIDCNQVA
ncbi:MAG: DUF3365 domain-containing protein [Pseudomonadota bacterium]